jgi:hypothetical protein
MDTTEATTQRKSTVNRPAANRSDPGQDLDGESALGLLKKLMDELATLFRQEVALATAEVMQGLTRFAAGILSMLAGGAVLFAGVLVLLAAAVLALATVLAPWLAALIVGGAVTVVGLILVFAGKRASDPSLLKPERSPRSLRKDKSVLMREE